MRDNWNSAIVGEKVVLVPYTKLFVDKYHEWMQDPVILEMTASDELTIEEEFEMQQTWRDDPRKCTFIIVSKPPDFQQRMSQLSSQSTSSPISLGPTGSIPFDEIPYLAGDTNIFLHDRDDPGNAEIEIMIAEKDYRRQGLAKESLSIMMHHGATKLQVHRFFAKIHESNQASIELFKMLGFKEMNYVQVFEEYEYEFLVDAASLAQLSERCKKAVYLKYSHSE